MGKKWSDACLVGAAFLSECRSKKRYVSNSYVDNTLWRIQAHASIMLWRSTINRYWTDGNNAPLSINTTQREQNLMTMCFSRSHLKGFEMQSAEKIVHLYWFLTDLYLLKVLHNHPAYGHKTRFLYVLAHMWEPAEQRCICCFRWHINAPILM